MEFEEAIYQALRRKEEVLKRRFIRKYGNLNQMRPYTRAVYEKKHGNTTKSTIKGVNKRINCGGYALEIDGVFLPNEDSLSGYVSSILEHYDFIRLLGDEPLHDDEYLVFYRFFKYSENEGKNKGHHFIKVNSDGLVVEKCGSEPVRIFEGWDERFKESPEVAFAVRKNHDYEIENVLESDSNLIKLEKGLDFEGSIFKAILQRNNQLIYHGHSFRLKKSSNEELFVINENGDIVAEVIIDGENTKVLITKGKEDYVENFSGFVRPIIQNGRLINIDEFRNRKQNSELER